jgi:acetyl-CoA synthetase/medium-chain acyl-CoA synthetase
MHAKLPTHFNFSTDVIERWGKERAQAAALWCVGGPHGERRLTFSQLSDQLRRAASFFTQLGIHRGDRVLIILPRVPEWWIVILGLIKIGAVPIPGTCLLTSRDIAYRLNAANASALITDQEGAARVPDLKIAHRILIGGARPGWTTFEDGLREGNPAFSADPTRSDDPGIIYFTSGTTGHQKMVLHTHASYGLGHRVTGELWLDLKPDDVHWCVTDTGWAKAAWSSLFGPWQMGACVFVLDSRRKFDPAEALQTLATYPITTWCAPPTALRLIVKEDLSRARFTTLRHCVSAGEPLNPEVLTTWKNATGLTIYDGYGQTETVVLIANVRALNEPVLPGSMGKPIPGFPIALLDEELHEVQDDVEGEIAIRVSPQRPLGLFKEYWKNPAENDARFRGDWYLTGDRAIRDRAGYFWFVGRGDDVIKSAGYRIGPFEVESALIEHPLVVEAAVVAKPDPIRGAIVKAFVVLAKESTSPDVLKKELQEHCKKLTAPYKYPREIQFVTELPKTISGKIRRVELRRSASVEERQ